MKVEGKIYHSCYFHSTKVKVGRGTWINTGCFFDNLLTEVSIGENCGIGQQVMFCMNTHEIGTAEMRASTKIQAPIKVGNGVWIGTRAVILPGVSIADGCVIAAGAVVTRDTEPNGLYAGVPARRIKDLP
jgi:maltose O-acetyltransferase